MKLIVGLGNPGLGYKYSRHNIGFRIVDALAKAHNIKFKTNFKVKAKIGQGQICREPVTLFKALRFMNICGLSLSGFMLERNIEIANLFVICDCLDLAFGKIRLKDKGRDAGHRGTRSIITSLGKDDFSRLKIGIGRPSESSIDISDYVLTRFSRQEEKELSHIIEEAKLKIYDWLKGSKEGLNNL